MIETLAALLFAHILADFILQTGWMVANKRRPAALLAHAAIVLLTAQAATGQIAHPAILALAAAHLLIDLAKAFAPPTLTAFLADQAAHLATILAAALLVPDLWATGLWSAWPQAATAMAHVGGLILATQAGGFAIGLLMAPWADQELPKGLPSGGKLIGLLERGLIFLFLTAGQPAAIGFLIAAKSVLRFETTSRDQRAGEYVIIGTLASFGWAIAATYGTLWLAAALPPLEIAAPTP